MKPEDFPVIYAGTDKFIDMHAYLERKRQALIIELRATDEMLNIEPTVTALCPGCMKKWNKREVGGEANKW